MPRIVSLHVGEIGAIRAFGRSRQSAIAKQAVASPVNVGRLGLDGDDHFDTRHHGGPAKAICCYPREHYPYWEKRLGRRLPYPAFGENFVTDGVTEQTAYIGDIFHAGSALVQISQPRGPCGTLAAYLNEKQMAAWAEENGLTGWYLSVLEPGVVQAGDALLLADRPGAGVTVMDVNRAMSQRGSDAELTERILAEPLLLGSWQPKLRKYRQMAIPFARSR